jgi:hypothetical protein
MLNALLNFDLAILYTDDLVVDEDPLLNYF